MSKDIEKLCDYCDIVDIIPEDGDAEKCYVAGCNHMVLERVWK
jgi:hypothetical protein